MTGHHAGNIEARLWTVRRYCNEGCSAENGATGLLIVGMTVVFGLVFKWLYYAGGQAVGSASVLK